MSGYQYQAKKVSMDGNDFASKMEWRFASLLKANNIDYTYSVWVEVIIGGERRFREIDFFLTRPIKPYWVSSFTNCFEIKGVLQPRDYERMQALKDQGLQTFIVTEPILVYWEQHSFLQHRLGQIKKKRKKGNGDNKVDF